MLTVKELHKIKQSRLRDAKALMIKRRYDGAIYLCGYAVELALKARICKTLKWSKFPESRNEFQGLECFKIHNLDTLLKLSGQETKIKTNYISDWSIVNQWNPAKIRYSIKPTTKSDASDMVTSSEILLRVL